MANQSISQLPVASAPLTGDELSVIVQNGVTKQTSLQNVANLGGPTGPQGPVGPQGPTGPAATIEVQSTTTTAPGTNANVINIGSPTAAYFEFYIPRGDVGATGATGATGPVGPGVAAGGTTGQVLTKASSVDYATAWVDVAGTGTVTSINVAGGTTGLTFSGGPVTIAGTITMGGTLGVANGGTGAVSLTGYLKGNGTSAFTGSATVPTTDLSGTVSNAQLANSAITINGTSTSLGGSINVGTVTSVAGTGSVNGITLTGTVTSSGSLTLGGTLGNIGNSQLTNNSVTFNGVTVALGASGSITADTSSALTIGTGLSGTSFNGSTPVTIAIDSTVATLTGTQTLTGKTISGASNTLSNIGNSSLTNSSITLGTTTIALGGTSLAPAGLTSVTVTQDPIAPLDLATKQYVDSVAEGLHVHASCAAATTGTLASITGGTVTYNNGTAGVGATLTLSVALTTLDGYTLLNTDRVLVKNEATQANNGIYTWATGGTVLTRATDFDTAAEIASGDFTFVTNGTLYGNTGWVQTDPVTTVGTSPITWIQFSGSGTYTAGTGLSLVGTQFSIANTAVTPAAYGSASQVGTFTVNQQGQLTLAGNTTISIPASAINTTIPNSGLTNSAVTINGSSVSLGGSTTVTATATNALTIGTGLTGTSYNGSSAVTVAIDSTVATLTGLQTLTNKTMSGASNTFSNIPNTAITGLGTMSTQDANNVNITGGTVSVSTVTATTGIFGGTF